MSQIIPSDFGNQFMPNLSIVANMPNGTKEDTELMTLRQKISDQNARILNDSNEIYDQNAKLNSALEEKLETMKGIMPRLEKIAPQQTENPLAVGIDHKIAEFNRVTDANNEKIKKNIDIISDIRRKKKENSDFFTKFHGEKKVWLDRLKEKDLREDAYGKGFKYLYEAKTVKLLLEGILLEKVQDEVEKELIIKGQMYGWDALDEERLTEERKVKEFDLSSQIANMTNQVKAYQIEQEQKAKWEQEDRSNDQKRQLYQEIWKQLWSELWLPRIPLSTEHTLVNQRELMKNVTMEVTFKQFQKLCFDVWKFKNLINSSEEYIVLDKIRRLFPEEGSGSNQDEIILEKMMDMIENIKQEEEIIYCDLTPAKMKLKEYEKSMGNKGNSSTSIGRLKTVIGKIENLQSKLKSDSTKLLKLEIEEISGLIKAIPDDNERKLFKDNLKNKPRLYDKYLPLTTLLMIVSFISIGQKRNKGYQDKIDNLNQENENLKLQNKEIEGKWGVLKEVNETLQKNKIIEAATPTPGGGGNEMDYETEYNYCKAAKEKLFSSYNEMSALIGQLNNLQNTFFKQIDNTIINVNQN